ncbi:MAG: nitrile hydratase subunit beta [Proteobacteria bacterium]|nr:nitrile hydratase subunit beta [Pseudomonadota bacterium]
MDSIHDLGGIEGFGPVIPEHDEPTFHYSWEGSVLGLQRAILYLGLWNIDVFRHAQEKIHPIEYLSWSYYERWAHTLIATALERGLFDTEEMHTGINLTGDLPKALKPLTLEEVGRAFIRGNFEREGVDDPKFCVGDLVMTNGMRTSGHTRLPRYARDKLGIIIAVRGRHVFPDAVVEHGREDPQWLYTVEIESCELWGDAADSTVSNSVDAFEPYLSRPEYE